MMRFKFMTLSVCGWYTDRLERKVYLWVHGNQCGSRHWQNNWGQVIRLTILCDSGTRYQSRLSLGMAGSEGTLARLENAPYPGSILGLSYLGLEFSFSPIKSSQVLAAESHVIPKRVLVCQNRTCSKQGAGKVLAAFSYMRFQVSQSPAAAVWDNAVWDRWYWLHQSRYGIAT